MGRPERRERRGGTLRRSSGRRCREGHDGVGSAGELRGLDVQRHRRRAISPVVPRPRAERLLGQRLGVRAVHGLGIVDRDARLSHRHDGRGDRRPRRLHGLRRRRVGLAGQRVGHERHGSERLFRDDGAAAPSYPDA